MTTPESMFTEGPLRNAARAGWHAAKEEYVEAQACMLVARRDEADVRFVLKQIITKREAERDEYMTELNETLSENLEFRRQCQKLEIEIRTYEDEMNPNDSIRIADIAKKKIAALEGKSDDIHSPD